MLGEITENEIGRDRRHLIEPGFAELALDVVFLGKAEKEIAAKFRINNEGVFESWLHTLTVLRNMAAHHDRFLHNKLGVSPQHYKAKNIKFNDNRSVYAALTMIQVLLESIQYSETFKVRIVELKARYGMGMLQIMGFPDHWPADAAGW